MLTVRQIERFWNANDHARLARELLAGRSESSTRTLLDCAHRAPAAALALIRIDEFNQPFHPLCAKLLRALIGSQDPDGGWGDAATTALVIRALSLCKGHGLTLERGLIFLGNLQKDDGLFPRIPLKRTDGDTLTTALVLHHLSNIPTAANRLNLNAAARALETAARTDPDARRLLPRRWPAGHVPTSPAVRNLAVA